MTDRIESTPGVQSAMRPVICGICAKDLNAWLLNAETIVICTECTEAAFVNLPPITLREGLAGRTGQATPNAPEDTT